MSILDRILGRAPTTAPQITLGRSTATAQAPPSPAVSDAGSGTPQASDEKLIRVYDQFGRKVEIGRETWRRDVLLPNLAASRGNPDALYDLIAGALNDDFAPDVLDAARLLAQTDAQPRRGAMLLGVVLLQLKDHSGARQVLERAIAAHGEDAHLLSNLARAFDAAGEHDRAQELIWRALQLAPNDELALNWYVATNARGSPDALREAYRRAAALPGSWRSQLWLARIAMDAGDLDAATRLYEEALGRAKPLPADLLMQLSGDLGNRGHTELLIRLTQPRFDLETHGLNVGNNLLRAFLELGMFAEARKLLEQLYAKQRPDWREHLEFWESKLDDAQKRYGEVTAPFEVVLMRLDQPVWTRGVLDFDRALPPKATAAPRVAFVCASGEAAPDGGPDGKVVAQPTNELGRLARALPMFLAEETFLRTNARTSFLLPWMKQGGFILSARPWTHGFLPPDEAPPEAVVFTHVDATKSPWVLNVTIERPSQSAERSIALVQSFELRTSAHDVLTLLHEVVLRLTLLLALKREETTAGLATPPAELLPAYLTAIEQALAIGLAARMQTSESFLYQERAIFDHLFDVALHGGDLLRPRMLLINALESETRRRPDIAREYLAKLSMLQQRYAAMEGPGAELIATAVRTVIDKAGR
jgi:tetratricopeptide (TPR) repeat protein